jgi:hypothetical protein
MHWKYQMIVLRQIFGWSMSLALCVAIILAWSTQIRAATPSQQRILETHKAVEQLVKDFTNIVFKSNSEGKHIPKVRKYAKDIKIGIYANKVKLAREGLAGLDRHLSEILAAVKLKVTFDNNNSNLVMLFHNSAEQLIKLSSAILEGYSGNAGMERIADTIEKNAASKCYSVTGTNKSGSVGLGFVFISETLGARQLKSCVLGGFFKALGLTHEGPDGSILNNQVFDVGRSEPTAQDWLYLRALYDDRIKSGMTLDQAIPIARVIFGEIK